MTTNHPPVQADNTLQLLEDKPDNTLPDRNIAAAKEIQTTLNHADDDDYQESKHLTTETSYANVDQITIQSADTSTIDMSMTGTPQTGEDEKPNKQSTTDTQVSDDKVLDDTALDSTLLENTASLENDDALATNEAPVHYLPSHVKLSGRMLSFTRLHIQGNDINDVLVKIEKKLGKQRRTNLPVVVSCEHSFDLKKLWQGLWQLGLQPIGIVTGLMDEQAKSLSIAIFPADGQRIDGRNTPVPTSTASANSSNKANSADSASSDDTSAKADTDNDKLSIVSDNVSHVEGDLVHMQMLRSGQSINHVGGDLILTRGINAGAEAITDCSLHVYGKAEGRLVAGATGDKNAKIFCLRFNPSLVSVAGTYCLRDGILPELIDKAVQVSYVEGQGLVFTAMES